MELSSYDAAKFCLGRICKRNHNHAGSGQSLRYISTNRCVLCEQSRQRVYRQTQAYRDTVERNRENRAAKEAARYQSKKADAEWLETRRNRAKVYQRRVRSEQGRQSRAKSPEAIGIVLPVGVGKGTTQLLAKHGLLRDGLTLNEIKALAEQLRFAEQTLRRIGRSPTVAELVGSEQKRYWRENPGTENNATRQFRTDLSWLKYQISPRIRIQNREKSKRRKSLMRGNVAMKLSAKAISSRFQQFSNACAYCGEAADLHIEHFIPIASGGTHALGNILPACKRCNFSKRDHEAESWYRAQPFFSEQRWRRILNVLGVAEAPGQLSFL